jgi:hypothetical protein
MSNVAKVLDILENHLPAIEDKFWYINDGGCGVMAALIAEQLDKLNVNYDIVCKASFWSGCNNKMSNKEVNSLLDEDNYDSMPNNHILIMVEGRIFDSSGEQKLSEDKITALIDHPTIVRMNDGDYWNKTFDRDQVDGMRVFTEKVFDKVYKKNHWFKEKRG